MHRLPPHGSCQLRTNRDPAPALITVCCVNREPLLASTETAGIVFDSLRWHDRHARWMLHAAVVMPDHVHFVADPLGADWRAVLWSFKSFTAHAINKQLQRHGAVWQAQYHDRRIDSETQLMLAIQYCEMNPVKAGLVAKPDQWSWFWERSQQG